MAGHETLRLQLIIPSGSSSDSVEKFRELFYEADGSILYPPDELDENDLELHVSTIVEDRADNRSDIQELYTLVEDEFPDHDVFFFEKGAIRDDNPFYEYSIDVIIGVCNGYPDSPQIDHRIPIGETSLSKDPQPINDGIYTTIGGSNLIGINVCEGEEEWRSELSNRLSDMKDYAKGIIVVSHSKVQLFDTLTGSEIWALNWQELVPKNADVNARNIDLETFELGNQGFAFVSSKKGVLYQISFEDGEMSVLSQFHHDIARLVHEGTDNNLYVILVDGSIIALSIDERDTIWEIQIESDTNRTKENLGWEDSSENDSEWASFDSNRQRRVGRPSINTVLDANGDSVFVGLYNGGISALDPTTGNTKWTVGRKNLTDSDESVSFEPRSLTLYSNSLYVHSNLGLHRLNSKSGEVYWNVDSQRLRAVQDDYVICANTGALLSTIYGYDIETGDLNWTFDMFNAYGGGGVTPYQSKIVLTTNDECLILTPPSES